jgi:3-dehydroquinate synthase
MFSNMIEADQVMVVTDSVIADLYLSNVTKALQGYEVITHVIPPGETEKNLVRMNEIITLLLENHFDRSSCLVALGGGVVGDLTGFTAACYQRGISFLQVPTTLLAQVDSSVGGKTAVNHKLGKNMIGAFYQPSGVIADVTVLRSLPEREYKSGLAEVIKYGLIRDLEFFDWLEENIDELIAQESDALIYAVERSCVNKAQVVEADETEKSIRATLNLGHTFGHAIETALNYKHCLHGEAIALGMRMAAHMSMLMGWLSQDDVSRIGNLLDRAGLPDTLPEQIQGINLRELMSVDKKVSHGRLKLVLLSSIGEAVVTDKFSENDLTSAIHQYKLKG